MVSDKTAGYRAGRSDLWVLKLTQIISSQFPIFYRSSLRSDPQSKYPFYFLKSARWDASKL